MTGVPTAQPACPICNKRTSVKAVGCSGTVFFCRDCQAAFDTEPDEGGDFDDRNPAARLEREERHR